MKQTLDIKRWTILAQWWRKIEPPIRPWPSEVRIYKKLSKKVLKGTKSPKILVLGATPEMRDVAASFKNAEVTVADISLDMLLIMRRFMKSKNPKEILVRGDWTTMPLSRNYYDLALGDGLTGNVEYKRHPILFRHISELLKPPGHFITRIPAINFPEWKNKSVEEILDYVLRHRLGVADLYFLLFMSFWNDKLGMQGAPGDYLSHQRLKKYWNPTKKKYQHPNRFLEKIMNDFYKLIPPIKKSWYNVSLWRTEKMIKPHFKIQGIFYGGTKIPICWSPIYLLKKK